MRYMSVRAWMFCVYSRRDMHDVEPADGAQEAEKHARFAPNLLEFARVAHPGNPSIRME